MKYKDYRNFVIENFHNTYEIRLDTYDIDVAYEEVSKRIWMFTVHKIFNFVSYHETIDRQTIEQYSNLAFNYAKESYRGFPRELRSIVVSNAVLVGKKIDAEAIRYVESNSKKHMNAFQISMIYDLENECLYRLEKYPFWGCRFKKFRKKYIQSYFDTDYSEVL